MQYAFCFDASRCASCFACEIACKSAHSLPPHAQAVPGSVGPRYRSVVEVLNANDAAHPVQYISMACMHCGSPDCMAVCPAKAIYRDPQFGAVLIDCNKCIGCRYCSWACEFGAPQFGEDGLMQKCDMCIDRLRAGKQPACVENCCGQALTFGPVEEVEGQVRRKAACQVLKKGLPAKALHG